MDSPPLLGPIERALREPCRECRARMPQVWPCCPYVICRVCHARLTRFVYHPEEVARGTR
jgi:hypothetical protein